MVDQIVSSKDQNVEHVNVDGQASTKHSSEVSPKTSSKDGMDVMLENDSWLIRNVPLTLEKWSPDANLKKEGGKPSYARAMNELRADTKLKDTLVVVLLKIKDDGYTLSTIRIEYAWKPLGLEESDSEVEGIDGDIARFMASLVNRAGGGANDASLLEDEDYDIYDDYEIDVYDLSEEQLPFCDAYGIRLRGRVRK
ncbi:hypothetical protein Tco_0500073 [Tanacetum coccineum]